jgi:hypothetical protein
MNYRLNELTRFPGWDTRADTDVPVNPRLPNSPLYTYDPQTGAAGYDVPREYNIPKVNPVAANNAVADPVAEYRTYIQNGTMNPVIYRAKGDTGNPEHDAYYTQAGGKILTDEDIVKGILRNEYGTGNDRRNNLLNLGLTLEDIKRVQGLVNARMYAAQARPAKRRKPAVVPVNDRPRQERILYQGMPMNWVGQHDPDYIYVR